MLDGPSVNYDNLEEWFNTVLYQTTLYDVQLFMRVDSQECIHYSDFTWPIWHLKSPAPWLFIQQADIKGNIKGPHYWPFVRGIHQSLVGSLHKGPVMRNAPPCDDVIMCLSATWEKSLLLVQWGAAGLILGLRPANERRCYKVTPSLIGWVQT